jgi:glycyl-tRNA synthetase alpha subunit
VENTHTSFDKITPKLVEFANKHREASFIFTSRKILPEDEQFLIENPFEEWEKEEWCVDLEPCLDDAHNIINTFTSAEGYSPTEQDIRWITNDFEEGTINLRRLNWYLETWKEKGGRLCKKRCYRRRGLLL